MYDVLDNVDQNKINKKMVNCGSQTEIIDSDVQDQARGFNNIFSFTKV